MPKYLLKAVSAAPDCNEFTQADEAWLDGYHIAGRALNRHAIRIHKGLGGRFDADMRYQSHHRLDRRQMKLDTVEMIEAGVSGLSSTSALGDTLCLIYDTDKPWSDRDPVLIMDDGSKAPILATKARPAIVQSGPDQAQQSGQGQATGVMPATQMMGEIQDVMQSITGGPVPINSVDPNDPNAVPQPVGGIPNHLQGVVYALSDAECEHLDEILEENNYHAAAVKADLDMLAGVPCETLQDLQQALSAWQAQQQS